MENTLKMAERSKTSIWIIRCDGHHREEKKIPGSIPQNLSIKIISSHDKWLT